LYSSNPIIHGTYKIHYITVERTDWMEKCIDNIKRKINNNTYIDNILGIKKIQNLIEVLVE
jgi:hypothetical protein